MTFIKRNGSIVQFDREKIVKAIEGAISDLNRSDIDRGIAEGIAKDIENECKEMDRTPTVDLVQNRVEEELMSRGYYDIARAYICYRYDHDRERVQNNNDATMKQAGKVLFTDFDNRENANVVGLSFGGRMGRVAEEVAKQFALNRLMSKKAATNHKENRIYTHDLSQYAVGEHNCVTLPFDDLLEKGFTTRQTDVRGAKSISTAMQLVAVLFQLQSLEQFGGCAASHLDWTLVPYVRKSFYKHYMDGLKHILCLPNIEGLEIKLNPDMPIDSEGYMVFEKVHEYAMDMTRRETYQAAEGLYHNLNTLQSRSGNQLPFTSINFGTCTLPEGRMVIKALLDVSVEGLGVYHQTPIYPCGIFQMKKGVNRKEGDPNYDLYRLALESTARRDYPNYANCDWSVNAGYDESDPRTYTATMGCRTYNGYDINGLGYLKDGRGNICPVTIILPTLAMEIKNHEVKWAKDNMVDSFIMYLRRKIYDAKDILLERYNYICSKKPEAAAFMYENNVLAGYDGKNIESAMRHGTLAIGQLGLAETLQILIGKDHTTEEGMELAKRIEKTFNELCAKFKKKYSLNFGVYYTPAENLCFTAMTKFKEKYGEIPNISENKFFTNSMHVPVWHDMTPFEKIDIESQLTGYSNAGCITYVELDASVKNNIDALEEIVNYAMDKDIPYFAVNVPLDTCQTCHYQDEISGDCPMCGSNDIFRLRRVTGYLTSDYKTTFNDGKQQEVEMRVRHQHFSD